MAGLLGSAQVALAATPVVDDPTFIVSAGTLTAPAGDMDLILLREAAFTSVTFSGWVNEDPGAKIISGNQITAGTHTCVQSLLVRFLTPTRPCCFGTAAGVSR